MVSIALMGRIDELDTINTLELLDVYLTESACYVKNQDGTEVVDFTKSAEYAHMYVPLGLPTGTYMVTGIEGKYYDGYVPGCTNHPEWLCVAPEQNDHPWALYGVTPELSAFDIMVMVSESEGNGYPNVNHVWFEDVDIDPVARTLKFNMGS